MFVAGEGDTCYRENKVGPERKGVLMGSLPFYSGLSDAAVLEQRVEGHEGAGHTDNLRKSIPGREDNGAEALKRERGVCVHVAPSANSTVGEEQAEGECGWSDTEERDDTGSVGPRVRVAALAFTW